VVTEQVDEVVDRLRLELEEPGATEGAGTSEIGQMLELGGLGLALMEMWR
jgi:hypothetical protein